MKCKITLFYLLSIVFVRCTTPCYLLPLVVICCHLLSLVVIRCHLLYHSFSFVLQIVVIRFFLLLFGTTRCTSHLSFIRDPQSQCNRSCLISSCIFSKHFFFWQNVILNLFFILSLELLFWKCATYALGCSFVFILGYNYSWLTGC